MEYRRLGTSELEVSVVAIGAWAMGGDVATWGPVNDNESIAAIKRGLDLGINLIDTAPGYGYGHSEEVVGKAIVGRREPLTIATKCGVVWSKPGGPLSRCLKPASVRKECEASLRRLRVETIDLYQIHWPDPDTPIAEAMDTLLGLREEGKIREIGVSNFSCEQMSQARERGPVGCLQPKLCLLNPQARDDLLLYCQEYGIGVIVYGPLGRGLLTGKFDPSSTFGDLRADDPRYAGEAFRRNLEFVEKLRAIARRIDCTVGQLAIRWAIQQVGVTAAITGVKRISQIEENARAGDMTLPVAEMDEIETLLSEQD